MKNALIVYAHQEPKSFNGALKDVAVQALEAQGHNVVMSDLYGMGFDPVASKHHFKELKNPDVFSYQDELRNAVDTKTLPDDVSTEINKILAADLIIFQFPMYGMGLPAILKGWIDRCFAEHVAFDTENLKWFDCGPFADKKAVLSFTTGGTPSFFSKRGVFGDMEILLWPIQNYLRFTGLQVMAPQICYGPGAVSDDARKEMIQSWKARLDTIWNEKPLSFVPIDNFDEKTGFEMKPEYAEKCLEGSTGPTVGQHLGLPLPSSDKP